MMMPRTLVIGLVALLSALPACKKKERKKPPPGAPAAAPRAKPQPNEALAFVPADAMAVVVAPTIKTLLSQGKAVLAKFAGEPLIAEKLEQARLDLLEEADIDLSRPETIEAYGVSIDRPMAMWLRAPPIPQGEPDVLGLVPLNSADKFRATIGKRAKSEGSEKVGGTEWQLWRDNDDGELNAFALLGGGKWGLYVKVPDDKDQRTAKLTRAELRGSTMADGDLWPNAEAAMAPAAASTHVMMYLNPAQIPFPPDADAQLAKRWLSNTQGMFFAFGASATGASGKVFVSVLPSARARWAALYQGSGKAADVMLPIGGSPLFAARASMNLLGIWNEVKTFLGPEWPKIQADIDKAMQELAAKTGVLMDLEKDLLGRINGRFGMAMDMPDLGMMMQMRDNPMMALGAFSFVFTAQVTDAEGIAKVFDDNVRKLPQQFALLLQRRDVAGGKALVIPGPGGRTVGGVIIARDLVTFATGKAFDRAVAMLEGKGTDPLSAAKGLTPAVKTAFAQPDGNVIHYDFSQLVGLLELIAMQKGGGQNPAQMVFKHLTGMSMILGNHPDGFLADVELQIN